MLILDSLLDIAEYQDHKAAARTTSPLDSNLISDPPGSYDDIPSKPKKSSHGIINNLGGLNQRVAATYGWAQQHHQNISNGEWNPWEIDMEADIRQWKKSGSLTDDERILTIRSLGLFSTANPLMANNLLQAICRHIQSPECGKYLLRQAFKEALHISACHHMAASLNISSDEILHAYQDIPALAQKTEWARPLVRNLLDPTFQPGSVANNRKLLKELVAFYIVFKGIFLAASLAQVISLTQYNKMVGTGRQFQHILTDTIKHLSFGIDLINQIKIENPYLWSPEVKNELLTMISDAVNLEIQQILSTTPRCVPSFDKKALQTSLKLTVNRNCAQLGLSEPYI